MTAGLAAILLLFAAVGFAGAGASLAVARGRRALDDDPDYGMLGVGALLLGFAALCAGVLGGLAAVLAVGLVLVAAGYAYAGQRLGSFQLECGPLGAFPREESHRTL